MYPKEDSEEPRNKNLPHPPFSSKENGCKLLFLEKVSMAPAM
jgi:hypothetical protein